MHLVWKTGAKVGIVTTFVFTAAEAKLYPAYLQFVINKWNVYVINFDNTAWKLLPACWNAYCIVKVFWRDICRGRKLHWSLRHFPQNCKDIKAISRHSLLNLLQLLPPWQSPPIAHSHVLNYFGARLDVLLSHVGSWGWADWLQQIMCLIKLAPQIECA